MLNLWRRKPSTRITSTNLIKHTIGEAAYRVANTFFEPWGSNPVLKTWNGSAWVSKPLKVWDGANWTVEPLKVWNGSTWLIVT